MLYGGGNRCLFSDKHETHTVWQKVKLLNVNPAVATRSQQALKGEIFPRK
jgi:hypothetical protein